MSNFVIFSENLRNLVERRAENKYGRTCCVKLNDVNKNNGIKLKGIMIREDNCNVSPTIYLNELFEAYEDNKMTLDEIADNVIAKYEVNKITSSIDMRFFTIFDRVKDRIIFQLINYEKNKDMLENIPHIQYLDLAIVFRVLVSEEPFSNATVLIHNEHMQLWKMTAGYPITIKELYELALKNTPVHQPYEIKNMVDIIKEMNIAVGQDESINMYVLTNKDRVQGASSLLYPDILADFGKAVQKDFYVLPSSIHECILLPAQGDEDADFLRSMVMEVNETQVDEEEKLSDSVYYFSRESGKLSII